VYFCRAAETSDCAPGLGDIITAKREGSGAGFGHQKGKVVRCVVVRMRKETRRKDGTYIRFDTNAAVLINEVGERWGRACSGRWLVSCATRNS